MGKLLQLLLRNGGFMTFVLVEVLCFYIIIKYNEDQNAIFSHTATVFSGRLLDKRRQVADYLSLQQLADSLRAENIRINEELANARNIQVPYRDTFFIRNLDTLLLSDSLRRISVKPQFEFISARAVGNSISGANNWLIINKGSNDGITPNMGLVSKNGVVGIIRHVGPNFSMAMSVLHRQMRISVNLQRHHALGSLIWEGGDPALMTLKFVPHHFKVEKGDAVVTSGYSQLFPKDILVGHVEEKPGSDPENPYFWIIKVRLNQDMASVNDLYVVNNIFYSELDSLNLKAKDE